MGHPARKEEEESRSTILILENYCSEGGVESVESQKSVCIRRYPISSLQDGPE